MNGKTAKLLRKIGRNTKKGKKMWNAMTHIERGNIRKVLKGAVPYPKANA